MKPMIAVFLGLMIAGPLQALPLATYLESVEGQCNGADSATGVSDTVPEGLNLDLSASHFTGNCQSISSLSISDYVAPQIDIQLSSSALSDGAGWAAEAKGQGEIQYYFQVTGPEETFVDISVSAIVSISGSRNGSSATTYSSAIGSVSGLPGGQSIFACSWFGAPIGCAVGPEGGVEQTLNYATSVLANQPYLILMNGSARAHAAGSGGPTSDRAEVQIIVDPIFGFVNSGDAALYTLEFSPNMSAVPLPATAALLPSGLLACAAWTRRRRRA